MNPGDVSTAASGTSEERNEPRESRASRAFYVNTDSSDLYLDTTKHV